MSTERGLDMTGNPEPIDVDGYLARIGYEGSTDRSLDTLAELHLAHLRSVPFENLDLVFGEGVPHDQQRAVDKIVRRWRGGWCFENNGAFALLLEALGFDVTMLGAAVLTDGPNDVIEHLTLEVMVDEPYLVDVGFGDCFLRPLALNRRGPQDGMDAQYEFFPSPKGTTLTKLVGGHPEPQYRFRRVRHEYAEFAPVADRLATDPRRSWSTHPFATRALGSSAQRVWLLRDRLRRRDADGTTTLTDVDDSSWDDRLAEWFGIEIERSRPADQTG